MHDITRRWLSAAFLLVSLSALFSAQCALAQRTPAKVSKDQARSQKSIMLRVVALLEGLHLTRHDLDDEISRRALPAFIESLDPMKVYFRRADLVEFEKSRDSLDDMLADGDLDFARRVMDRYRLRIAERVQWTREFVDAGQDFTLDEKFVTDPDSIEYPKDNAAARERWRRRVKYDLLRLKGLEVPDDEAKEQVKKRYKSFLRRTRQLDDDDVLSVFIGAIAMSYDPHTSYMSKRTLENFEIQMRLNYQGIGARLNDEDGYAVVSSIMPGGPAMKQGGLVAEDRILGVAQGKDGEFKDVVNMRLNDTVQLIRGKADTIVRLKIRRKGNKDPIIVKLIRGKTELLDQKAIGKVFEVGSTSDKGAKVKVGVVDLPGFYGNMGRVRSGHRSATEDVKSLLQMFAKKDVDVVVLDLRFNGGGLLPEAVSVAGLFIDEGPVVQVRGFGGRTEVLSDKIGGAEWSGPLVVLTSRFSASASEIVAGAIKDYGRGLIVGDESSHGKGTVQQVLELGRLGGVRGQTAENLGALKLTIQQFYRPGGISTQVRGVRADVQLPSFTNEVSEGESELDHVVPFGTISPKKHDNYRLVSEKIVEQVGKRSKGRIGASEHFGKLKRDIERYRARKNRKSITLNEKKYLALLESMESDDKKVEEGTRDSGEPKRDIELDDYLREVMAVASDYRELLQGRRLAQRR